MTCPLCSGTRSLLMLYGYAPCECAATSPAPAPQPTQKGGSSPSSTEGVGAEGEMSDEAIRKRWSTFRTVGLYDNRHVLPAFVRSEVERARPKRLTEFDMNIAWRRSGGADDLDPGGFAKRFARELEKVIQGES